MKELSASIVVYKNSADILLQAIKSFLESTSDSQLFIIDNSPTDCLKHLTEHPRITYIFNNKNVGFGAGHNIAIRQILNTSKYHLVLNPDVYFNDGVINNLYAFMEQNSEVGQIMPKVLYPDGQLQHLCRLLPTPKILVLRRFFNFMKHYVDKENYQHELQFSGYDKIIDAPFLSGCFMFLRLDALKKSGLFDEQFFLYTEDTDLTRRIHKYYRTVYFPEVTIYHHHARGSYKDLWLTWCSIQSAIKYFNKWGWFVDPEREAINQNVLLKLTP